MKNSSNIFTNRFLYILIKHLLPIFILSSKLLLQNICNIITRNIHQSSNLSFQTHAIEIPPKLFQNLTKVINSSSLEIHVSRVRGGANSSAFR